MAWSASTTTTDPDTRQETIPCPICDGNTFTPLFEKAGEPFVQCNSCGLVLINPRPAAEHVATTYDRDYTQGYIRKQDKKLKRISRWVKRIQNGHVPQGRWLDIGCSAGFVVHCARMAGFDAYGVDIEPTGIDFARRHFGLDNVFAGTLEERGFPNAHFDVISAYELIEHVPDVNRLLEEIRRLLAPGGLVEIRTPDAGHWRVRNRLESWEAILPSEHLYYFSRDSLARLLEKHGLKIIRQRFSLKPGLKIYATHAGAH